MSIIFNLLAGFFAGITASMGLGGGLVLILYMSIFTSFSQIEAQGINLIFFIPIAIFSLILNENKKKDEKKLIRWKSMIISIIFGIIGAFLGSFLTSYIDANLLRKFFAIFIIIIGIRELFYSFYKPNSPPK